MRTLIALALVAFAVPALAAPTYVIDWTAPTTRTDGSSFDPDTELGHYDFMCGTSAGGPYDTAATEIPPGNVTTDIAAEGFFPGHGTYYCVLTATDIDDRESPHSAEVELPYTAPPSAPGGPTINIITE